MLPLVLERKSERCVDYASCWFKKAKNSMPAPETDYYSLIFLLRTHACILSHHNNLSYYSSLIWYYPYSPLVEHSLSNSDTIALECSNYALSRETTPSILWKCWSWGASIVNTQCRTAVIPFQLQWYRPSRARCFYPHSIPVVCQHLTTYCALYIYYLHPAISSSQD